MATKPKVVYEEMRIDVRDPHQSHLYVLCRVSNVGSLPSTWHHKAFPASKPVLDVIKDWQLGLIHPIEWDVVALN
jgi:hypothetical protein